MKIKTATALTALFSLSVLVLLAFDLFQLLNIHHDVVKSEEARFQSYKLADQLRQSSDDLTRMARTYVVTGDERYEKNYFTILDIRNGKLPRPQHYSNTYWWHEKSEHGSDGAVALQTLMRRAGFSDAEFALLAESQARSDALVNLEKQAFDAMRGHFTDARQGKTVEHAPDPALARALLFGARYHAEKTRIMQPINAFLESVDRRTGLALRSLEERQAAYLRLALAIAAMACMVTLAGWGYLNRKVLRPVLALRDHVASLTGGANEKIETVNAIAEGKLEHDFAVTAPPPVVLADAAPNEIGQLLGDIGRMSEVQRSLDLALRAMTQALRSHRAREALLDWHKSGINELNLRMRGEFRLADLGPALVSFLSTYVGAAVGALYLYDPQRKMLDLLASHATSGAQAQIALGEGVAGAAAEQQRPQRLAQVPPSYLHIASATGHAAPASILAVPLLHDGKLLGLVEVSGFQPFTEQHLDWLAKAGEALAIAIDVAQARERVNELLMQTQAQTEELRVQQEQLQQSNEELEERAHLLEQQREIIRKRSQETEAASKELARKAEELQRVSAYKSEFLANMSHELRTPLNSMLILSSLLEQNKGGRLDAKQVEYATTIHGAGRDLLNLINDILDLSKIEAGQMDMHIDDVDVGALLQQLQAIFNPVAEQKNVALRMAQLPGAPQHVRSDEHRLLQILKNLLGNAFKFTSAGEVALTVGVSADSPLGAPALAFAVRDSGIGIAAEKHDLVFHAFQQADGSTARQYGGSGLGLSISRQLAHRLGGEITLASVPGQGSTFTVYLPLQGAAAPVSGQPAPPAAPAAAAAVPAAAAIAGPAPAAAPGPSTPPDSPALPMPPGAIEDDRKQDPDGRRAILIIEDDPAFAGILRDKVREHGFLALVASDGEAGLALAERRAPQAIILDVMLPHMDGWGVMRRIKENQATRDIPVHFITCVDERQRALDMGAVGFARKPVSAEQLEQIMTAIGGASITQCSGRALGEVSLFLRQVESTLPHERRAAARRAIDQEAIFSGRTVLLVDDDIRNVFSLSSVLDGKEMHVVHAGTGREALEQLEACADIDIVLMDVMMPEMDGFEAMRRIRAQPRWRGLPIIALTAKAMADDRQQCLDAGASDYIAKPIDIDKLFSLMRVWLYRDANKA